jgi:hypothetical protein
LDWSRLVFLVFGFHTHNNNSLTTHTQHNQNKTNNIQIQAFPAKRPPMFKFRTYADARGWGCASYRNNTREVWVDHAPLPGVTPAMLAWHFDNLARGRAASPLDNKTYPHFLLYHPRDHIKHWVEGAVAVRPASDGGAGGYGLRAGTKTFWQEVQATGCSPSATAPAGEYRIECPSGPDTPNPGLVAGAPRSSYTGSDQVNSAKVGPSRIRRFVRPATSAAPAAGVYRIELGVRRFNMWPTLTAHSWCVFFFCVCGVFFRLPRWLIFGVNTQITTPKNLHAKTL